MRVRIKKSARKGTAEIMRNSCIRCRLAAADVNGVGGINTVDVVAIQRFFLGLTTGIANVERYQFNPVIRTYPGVITNQTNQNYDALIFGDVAASYVH